MDARGTGGWYEKRNRQSSPLLRFSFRLGLGNLVVGFGLELAGQQRDQGVLFRLRKRPEYGEHGGFAVVQGIPLPE